VDNSFKPEVPAMLVALVLATAVPSAEPTFSREVSRIVQTRCQECHHAGTAAPFSLLTYEDVVKHADTIREAVINRRMPPWGADPHYGKFANDRHLTDAELQTLTAWIDGDRAKGDPKDAPPARQWTDGWTIGEPDVIVEMPIEQDIPAAGTLDYKGCEAPIPEQKEDWLVVAAELQPGVRQVVHHAQVYVDTISNMVLSYAPGTQAVVLPPSTVFRIPRGQSWFGCSTTRRTVGRAKTAAVLASSCGKDRERRSTNEGSSTLRFCRSTFPRVQQTSASTASGSLLKTGK
jgi:hypothetical protein